MSREDEKRKLIRLKKVKKREQKIRKDVGDCSQHILCRWMRKFIENKDVTVGPEAGCLTVSQHYMKEAEDMITEIEKMSKETRPTKREELVRKMVNKFGGVELDRDEEQFLALGPDFALYEDISVKKTDVDFMAAATKIRWSRMGKPTEEVTYQKTVEEVESEENIEK